MLEDDMGCADGVVERPGSVRTMLAARGAASVAPSTAISTLVLDIGLERILLFGGLAAGAKLGDLASHALVTRLS